ncbi:hypothetical protein [Methanothrix sp.]|jgi:hypothetical protein|uniref:hypothetical protein n=1 Tax=Methanothrix sp. TaxID=90426 RepID=UPI003BB5B06C
MSNEVIEHMLLEKLTNFKERAYVFRIKERDIEEIERDAKAFAINFIGKSIKGELQPDLRRQNNSTILLFNKESRIRVYHNSGAIIAKNMLGPLEDPITDTSEKEVLTERVTEAAKKIIDEEKFNDHPDGLRFERLWQIKAAGVTRDGQKGPVILCRVVGAFRRYLHGFPVWGGASAYAMIAGDNIIDSAGLDYRPCIENPIDRAGIIDPQEAAELIIKKLSQDIGRSNLENYIPEMFSLGYLSLPKRRRQAFMQPVYAGVFRTIDKMNPSRFVALPALEVPYESIFRVSEGQPTR